MNRKVKSLMVLKGIKNVDIARKLGLSPVTVSIVLTGRRKSRRIQKAIAEALGVNYEKLWHKKHGSNSSSGLNGSSRINSVISNVG